MGAFEKLTEATGAGTIEVRDILEATLDEFTEMAAVWNTRLMAFQQMDALKAAGYKIVRTNKSEPPK